MTHVFQELSSWPPAGTAPCSSEAAVCTTLASFAKHTAATISLTCTLAETRYHTELPSRQDEEAVGRPHMLPGQVVAGDLQLVPMVYPNFEEDFRAKGTATLEAYNSSSRGGRQSSAYPTLALEEAGLGELAASETQRKPCSRNAHYLCVSESWQKPGCGQKNCFRSSGRIS